jgi:hypothetical protein
MQGTYHPWLLPMANGNAVGYLRVSADEQTRGSG